MVTISYLSHRDRLVLPLTVFAVTSGVYWRTAYPTITWWDSSSYSLAAATLGIGSPPGSLMLTLLGWVVTKLAPAGATAHALNLFAGLLGGLCAALVYIVTLRLTAVAAPARVSQAAIGAAVGALTFAFSNTLWEYAVQFTPYVLTAVFTALILWTMLRWWEQADEPDAWRWLALLGLLFGLDFSVHRTNALLLPGALAWILLRRPRTLADARLVLAGAGGLVAGLAAHLLIIPMAAASHSPLNFNDPSSLSRFWDYISLKSLGGGFLLNLYPRKSDLWSMQTADFLRAFAGNFLDVGGKAGPFGALPAVGAVIGFATLFRANRRLATALALVFFLQAATTVAYFNIPPNYFRSFDRHYLPAGVTFAVFVAFGVGVVVDWIAKAMNQRKPALIALAAVATIVALAAPAAQLTGNWQQRNASKRWFARDWATNALQGLPPNAIYFTAGDNDTFPVLYLQSVEGVRRDVTIINLNVAQVPGYGARIRARDPSFPLGPTTTPLDLVRDTTGRRPVTYATTAGGAGPPWPNVHGRLEGLFWRVVSPRDSAPDIRAIRATLFEKSVYRGYADSSVLDTPSRHMGFQYFAVGAALLAAETAQGDVERCRADRRKLLALVPPARLGLAAFYSKEVESACGDG